MNEPEHIPYEAPHIETSRPIEAELTFGDKWDPKNPGNPGQSFS